MTIEEKAQEYADKHGFRVPYDGSNKFYNDIDVKASYEGFKAGVEFAQRFIPVEEELPKPNTDFPFTKYLVQVNIFAKNYSCQTCTVAHYECGKWYTDRDDEDIIEITVTHWRPIHFK